MNIYWKTACAVGLMTVGFLGGWYVNGNRLGKQIAEIQQAHTEEKAKAEEQIRTKEQEYRNEIQNQAEKYQADVTASSNDIEKLKSELKNVQKQKPISTDCSIDTDRMRLIKQIGSRANSRNTSN